MTSKSPAFTCCMALLLLGGSGCGGAAITGTAELPLPSTGVVATPNVASVPTPLAEVFDFQAEALTSRASLVRMDDDATCFDVIIRRPVLLPKDQRSLELQLSVEIDGIEGARRRQALPVCAPDTACLPLDSSLRSFMAENDARIRVEGQRLCFERLPRARRELVLTANPGSGAWRFRFHFVGS